MFLVDVNVLKPHPRNDYFFDDVDGISWENFLKSVSTSGVIVPIVITPDNVIISGHQRVRAAKVLGIKEIKAEVVDHFVATNPDEILKQMIETNIIQRGIGNLNPIKFGRCIKELERIYGIQNGGNRGNQYVLAEPNNSGLATQEDLANQLGISTDTLRNYKLLADAIPEVQELITTGIVTPTTARAIIKQLPEDQQRNLANQFISSGKKITATEAKNEIAAIKEVDNSATLSQLEKQIADINQQLTLVTNERDSLLSINETLTTQNANLKEITSDVTNNWDPDYFSKPYREIDNLSCLNEYCRNAMYLFNSSLIKADDVRISLALKQDDDARRQYLEFLDFVSDWLKRQYARVNATDTIIDIATI